MTRQQVTAGASVHFSLIRHFCLSDEGILETFTEKALLTLFSSVPFCPVSAYSECFGSFHFSVKLIRSTGNLKGGLK